MCSSTAYSVFLERGHDHHDCRMSVALSPVRDHPPPSSSLTGPQQPLLYFLPFLVALSCTPRIDGTARHLGVRPGFFHGPSCLRGPSTLQPVSGCRSFSYGRMLFRCTDRSHLCVLSPADGYVDGCVLPFGRDESCRREHSFHTDVRVQCPRVDTQD